MSIMCHLCINRGSLYTSLFTLRMSFHIQPYSLAIVHSENSSYRDNLEQTYVQLSDHPFRSWLPKSTYLDPALIQANISGIALRSTMGFEVIWDGGNQPESLVIEIYEAPQSSFIEGYQRVFSRLGKGIFQVTFKALIRTPRDVNLMIVKPINFIEYGYEIIPAIIETDSYTNEISFAFRVTIPKKRIYIEYGSVLASLIPIPRHFVDGCKLSISPKSAISHTAQKNQVEEKLNTSATWDNSYKYVFTAQAMGWNFQGQDMLYLGKELFTKIPKLANKEIQIACPKNVLKHISKCIRDRREKNPSRDELPEELAKSVPVGMASTHSIDIIAPFSFAVHWNPDKEEEAVSIELDLDDPLAEKNILTIINNFENGIFSCVFSLSCFTDTSSRLFITSPLSGAINGITTLSRIIDSHCSTQELVIHMKVSFPSKEFIKIQKGQVLASCIPIPAHFVAHFKPYYNNTVLDVSEELRMQKKVQYFKKLNADKPKLIANPDDYYASTCIQNPFKQESFE